MPSRWGSARRRAIRLVVALVVLACGGSAPAAAASRPPIRPGAVLVGFRPGVSLQHQHAVERAAGAVRIRRAGVAVLLRVRRGHELAAVRHLRRRPSVRYAEPDYVMRASATPNDPGFAQQWGPSHDGATSAWDVGTGSPSIVVAEVDTGVEYTHPDLAANIWTNTTGVGGCANGTHGYNVLASTCDPMDDDTAYNGHGTHVAGILGGVGNNGIGVAGMSWSTTILPVKWLDSSGSGSTSGLLAALEWVVQAKQAGVNVRVVNDSATFVGTAFSQALSDEIDKLGANGILFVTAAGNTGDDNDDPQVRRYPCGYDRPTEICVTAGDVNDRLPSWANYGASTVDLAAPGDHIYSTLRGGAYGYISGGSMASPQVAGAAALVLSKAPGLSVTDLRARLLDSVDPLPALDGLVRTGGRLNVCRALPGCAAAPQPQPESRFGTTTIGSSVDAFGADRKRVNAATLTEPGTLTRLRIFLEPGQPSGQQALRGVVYADAGGAPGRLLGVSSELVYHASDERGWYELPMPSPVSLTAGRHWIGVLTGATGGIADFRYTAAPGSRLSNADTYADGASDTFGPIGSTDGEQMSLYAVYAPPGAASGPAAASPSPSPSPSSPAGDPGAGPPVEEPPAVGSPSCAAAAPLAGATAHPAGNGLALHLPARAAAVDVQVLAQTADGGRRVARFRGRSASFVWPARGLADGVYVVRFGGAVDVRTVALVRRRGRFASLPAFRSRSACGPVALFALSSPVFGGPRDRGLTISYRLATAGRAEVRVLHGTRTLHRFTAQAARAGRVVTLHLSPRTVPAGEVSVVLRVSARGRAVTQTLAARRL